MGYFRVGTSKLDDWTSFATGQLGLQAVDRGGAMRSLGVDWIIGFFLAPPLGHWCRTAIMRF